MVLLGFSLLDFAVFIVCEISQNDVLLQGPHAKSMIHYMSLYFVLKLTHAKFVDLMTSAVQAIVRDVPLTLGAASLPLASVSNTLNNPKPLKLDVSLPSIHDIRWSLARLLYLFNIQLERNVAT